MGLLDFNLDDQGQMGLLGLASGLLSAGAPSRTRVSTGQALTSGLLNMAKMRQSAQDQSMDNQLSSFKLQDIQNKYKAQEAMKLDAIRKQKFLQENPHDYIGMIKEGFDPEWVKKLSEANNFGRSKVSRIESIEQNGNKVKQQFNEYGDIVGDAMPEYIEPKQIDLGDKVLFETPKSGVSLSKGYSPSDKVHMRGQDVSSATTMRGQDINNALGWANNKQRDIHHSDRMSERGMTGNDGGQRAGVKMSATMEKKLIESDDAINSSNSGIDLINQALSLNNKAYDGYGALPRAVFSSNIRSFSGQKPSEKADATIALDNIIRNQVVTSLKSSFGGNPTEGERKFLVDIQASADKTPAQRKEILERGLNLLTEKMNSAKNRASAIRSGKYKTSEFEVENKNRSHPDDISAILKKLEGK